ncbi:MAG: three-Cys-motif partner protein TcmP [Candidatus Eremiobacteraeota bacterium]|nr:three-Cys-motif partner protein TcmP [Candidatus Eremiobacteraeota bacterium]
MTDIPKKNRRFTSTATEGFFEVRDPQNKHKTEIIEDFFKAYAAIILTVVSEIDYVDLYAGRGFYDRCASDPSLIGPIDATPLRILRAIIANERFSRSVRTWFNEGLPANVADLRTAIAGLPGIETLAHVPLVTEGVVNDRLAARLRERMDVPTFFFLDPFGYVGITRQLLQTALTKSWGCDIAFFFNYKRINMNLGTNIFDSHLIALFGDQRLSTLRAELQRIEDVDDREDLVLASLQEALKEIGARYFLRYRFRYPDGKTSHHLVFVTTHRKGHDAMKDRMAAHSAKSPDGVPYFEFVPGTPRQGQPGLFDTHVLTPPRNFPYSIRSLANKIYNRYRGRTFRIDTIFQAHSVGLPYTIQNFRAAILDLQDRRLATLLRQSTGAAPKRGQCPPDTDITIVPI